MGVQDFRKCVYFEEETSIGATEQKYFQESGTCGHIGG